MNGAGPFQESQILTGPLFSEPMRVETAREGADGSWTLGLVGTQPERFRKVTLATEDLASLTILDPGFAYDGDGTLLRLGLQAYALGIAWEFDPYFGLSISRVDPLPHQLEAVYDYLLKLARVRFLLADDAGAGKTIMAGSQHALTFVFSDSDTVDAVRAGALSFRDSVSLSWAIDSSCRTLPSKDERQITMRPSAQG